MKQHLSIVNEAIVIPGVVFRKNGVLITKPVTAEQLNGMVSALAELHQGTAWWWGDLGVALQKEKGAHYVSERSVIVGIDEGYWRNCTQTSRFFEIAVRNANLSFSHHYVAMIGGRGDLEKAREWLSSAEKLGWSVSDLRKHVNMANATVQAPTTEPEQNEFEWLDKADHWARGSAGIQLDSVKARMVLSRIKDLVAYIDKLKAAASS